MVGSKRHLLTLETRAAVLDIFGEETWTYTTLTVAWGMVEAVSSQERLLSQQVQEEVSHRITIRYSEEAAGLRAQDRITLGSRTFDIVTPMDRDGRSKELVVMALERP